MRTLRLLISQQMFDLLTGAIAQYSRKSGRFETFRSTVQHACVRTRSMEFGPEDLAIFLGEHTLEGRIAVFLQISESWQEDYRLLREKIVKSTDKPVTDRTVIGFAVYLASTTQLL